MDRCKFRKCQKLRRRSTGTQHSLHRHSRSHRSMGILGSRGQIHQRRSKAFLLVVEGLGIGQGRFQRCLMVRLRSMGTQRSLRRNRSHRSRGIRGSRDQTLREHSMVVVEEDGVVGMGDKLPWSPWSSWSSLNSSIPWSPCFRRFRSMGEDHSLPSMI